MIKKFDTFIKESKDQSSVIDEKMSELSDLIKNSTNDTNFMYQWEDKEEMELVINFVIDESSYRFEFDIDDLFLIKIVGNKIDYTKKVSSIEDGLDMIEKDIQKITGLEESILLENNLEDDNISKICDLILSIDESKIDSNSEMPLIDILDTHLNDIDDKLRKEIIDITLFNMFDKHELIEKIGYTLSSHDLSDEEIVKAFEKAVKKIKSYE
jgi:hypothetical protein